MSDDDPLPELLRALADLRRFWERPDRKRRLLAELGEQVELGVLRTLAAVDTCGGGEEGSGVGRVAGVLAVDGSTASRLVDQAVTAGYLVRRPGEQDRRRIRLELTEEGAALLERARTIQRRWLDEITEGWEAADVQHLAALLRRFVDDATPPEEPAS